MQATSTILDRIVTNISTNAKRDGLSESSLSERPRLGPAWQAKWLRLEITHPDVQKLADGAASFASAWFWNEPRNRWRVVMGAVGTAKTHTAKALARWANLVALHAWEKSWHKVEADSLPSILYRDWVHYASPEVCSSDDFAEFVREVQGASLVFLDDIGIETDQYRTGIPAQRLCQILNLCEGKFLWLTTNVRPNEWVRKWDQRVEDRLLTAETILVNSPSYRSEVYK